MAEKHKGDIKTALQWIWATASPEQHMTKTVTRKSAAHCSKSEKRVCSDGSVSKYLPSKLEDPSSSPRHTLKSQVCIALAWNHACRNHSLTRGCVGPVGMLGPHPGHRF